MIDHNVVGYIRTQLLPNETVQMTVKQRHFGPGGSAFTPTHLIATNMRLIVLYREQLGLKKTIEIIPYVKLTTVRLERGVFSSTIHLHVIGVADQAPVADNRTEEEFSGLYHKGAEELANFLNKKISKDNPENFGSVEDYSYCTKCGSKVAHNFAFCPTCGAKQTE